MSEWAFPVDAAINIATGAAVSSKITGEAASFVLTGFDSTFVRTNRLVGEVGFFSFTGYDTEQKSGKRLTAEVVNFVVAEMSANLLYEAIQPSDPTPVIEDRWVPIDAGLDAGLTVDQG